MGIRALHYELNETALMEDAIVQAMAAELPTDLDRFYHASGTPRAWFMSAASDEYKRRGGSVALGSMGAVANAVYRVRQGAR